MDARNRRHPESSVTPARPSRVVTHDVRLGYSKSIIMLSSVFSRRKGLQRKLTNFTRRAQSPSSPGSFTSPDCSEKPFNPFTLYNGSSTSQLSTNQTTANGPTADSGEHTSPRVQLDLTTDALSLSDWFPAELLQAPGEVPTRMPERNASLKVIGVSGSVPGGTIGQMEQIVEGGADGQGSLVAEEIVDTFEDESDNVIVIEGPRGREPTRSPRRAGSGHPQEAPFASPHDSSMPGQSRRHPPHPIKIPAGNDTKLFSHADTESAQLSKASSKRQSSRSLSNYTRKSTRAASLRQSRHHSLTHSRPRFHSRSRPSSLRSARSHNEESDADDALSTVSGTTIARALVSSYFITTSPSGHRSRSSMVLTKHRPLARQDSTTLPIADYPFLYRGNSRRRSHRSSKGSTSSDVRTPISGNYWRDRKISGDQIVVLSPEERQKEEWTLDVPPLPPMPSGLSPMPPTSARSLEQGQGPGESQDQGQSQSTVTKNVSGSFSSAVGSSSGRFGSTKTLSTGSISGKWSGKYIIVDAEPEQKRRSVSVVSEWTESAPGQSSMSSEASGASDDSMQHVAQAPNRRSVTFSAVTSNESVGMKPTSVEDGQDISYEPSPLSRHTSSPDAPTTATSPSTSVYSKNAYAGASVSPAESTSLYSSPGHGGILSPGLTSIVSSADSSYVRTPGSSVAGSAGSQDQSFRSFAASRQPRNLSPGRHLITMLPIGERPRSTLVSHSPSSHNTSSMIIRPQSMVSSTRTSLDSPDLLDIMFAGSRGPLARNSTIAMRVISPPAPISVPPRTPFALSNNDEASPSAVRQQFPETPYAFTPLASAGFSPAPDEMPLSLPRTGSLTMRGSRARRGSISMGRKVLIKSATMASPPSSATPEAPPYSVIDSTNVVSATPSSSTGGLSIIEEVSVLNSPVSQYDHSPPDSPALSTRRAYTDPAPSYPASPADIRLSMPPAYELDALSVPLPPSRSPTPSRSSSPASHPTSPHKRRHESTLDTEDPSDTTIHAESEEEEVSPPPSPRPSLPPSPQSLEYRVGSESAESASSLRQQQHLHPAYGSTGHKARARTRPPPPTGPRKPTGTGNFTTLLNRARDASVSSVTSSPNLSAGPGGSRNPMSDSSSPKFQTTPVKFRGLTMEAAQWTFTSQELQSIVSTAVKQSSDPYAIRLLPSDTVQTEVPEEIERVEKLSADLKTKYKLGMRKREKLLGTLRSIAEGSELADHAASSRYLEELVELSDSLDHISEDLYIATDQLRQLTHLRDLHATSALAMAVRKLNTSFIKHLAENQRLRQQVVELRDERDEAWAQAENAARELDAFCGQLAMGSDGGDGATTPGQSRRSSAVVVARKVSVRKASLRSSSRMRSQRSPVASNTAVSPANRIAPPDEVIPPVPPIPMRVPLGVLTAGLSTGVSSGMPLSSSVSGSEEVRALMRAQEELYEMLGLRLDELPAVRKRSMSLSDVASPPPYQENIPRPRRNSDMTSPNTGRSASWHDHRTAVLATIGMSP